jgi:predicted small secreted protein
MKFLRYAILVIGIATLTVGCRNTMKGAGRDIERMGDKIENAADS